MSFNASVFVSEQLNRMMMNAAQELAQRAVSACAEQYNFDAEEAIRLLGLRNVKLERKVLKGEKKAKVVIPKPKFPLPYNGELNDSCCYALRQNNGLYTQCSGARKGKGSLDGEFCKSCVKVMQKTGDSVPEYGTIQQRQAVGIFEYVDPKGRKPVAYTKVMKKYKVTQEEVLEEAGKFNININANHFIAPEEEKKRGRRAKELKEEKPKGSKGRPKKVKKVLQIEGDDEDLFAALVEEANATEDDSPKKKVVTKESASFTDAEKEAKAAKKEQERLEREAKKKAEEEAKAAKKEQERLEREAKKKAEEEEKAAKAAKKEQERLEREAKKKAEEEAKKAKEQEKAAKKEKKEKKQAEKRDEEEEEEEDEPDVVKKIEVDGKKYLKSKKTGIVYDYKKYVNDNEQVKVGKWNENTKKIDFIDDEESEEEYD